MTPPYFGFSPDDLRRIESESSLACVEFHDTLDSTNDRALVLVRESSVELPALVLAANQTAGRGRAANQWFSGPGALTFSLAIETPKALPTDRLPIVSLVAGLAVCETLVQFLPDPESIGLKWPNDVLLEGGKVCGILVESISAPRRRLVMGVGLNVNNDVTDVEGIRRPVSIASVTRSQLSLTEVLIQLVAQIDERMSSLADGNDTWLEACRQFCVLTGRTVQVNTGNRIVTGHCQGIGPDGALLLETTGKIESLYSGTIVEVE